MNFTSKALPLTMVVIFVAVMLAPVWMNRSGGMVKAPKPEITEAQKAAFGTECVRPASWMRANHMQLLNTWRDEVVRDSLREDDYNDRHIDKSLTRTCLKCHDNKKNFCDRCHTYASVKPYCWTCHVVPKEKI